MREPLDGIAAADAWLGEPFPLPRVVLPLVRWTTVTAVGDVETGGVEVEWNLDDTRPGAPGRLALWVGRTAPPAQDLGEGVSCEEQTVGERLVSCASAPLAAAQPSLQPVTELSWRTPPFFLRLTAQGPWAPETLMTVVASVPGRSSGEPV